jgi:hypothetical protein
MRGKWPSIIAVLALAAAAAAQSTVLTYQGRLKNGGEPATGLHDIRFRLFDAVAGGSQLGTTQCLNNVTVADGLFTASIDFGQQFASPDQRFLEIQVREDTGLGCGNGAGFVTLNPRQPLTAAPLASHANSAFALDAADGGPLNAVFVDSTGNVGIGTTTPSTPLHIESDPMAVLILQDPGPADQQAGYVGFWNGNPTETAWVGFGTPGSPHFSIVNARSGGNIALLPFAGNVGVGTSSPTAKLEVHGDIRLGASGQFRAAAGEESLRIIRGTVNEFGQIVRGTGFTCEHLDLATYRITFNTAFAGTPSVMATAGRDGVETPSMVVMTDGTSTTAVTLIIRASADFWVDQSFSFIAVGPR